VRGRGGSHRVRGRRGRDRIVYDDDVIIVEVGRASCCGVVVLGAGQAGGSSTYYVLTGLTTIGDTTGVESGYSL